MPQIVCASLTVVWLQQCEHLKVGMLIFYGAFWNSSLPTLQGVGSLFQTISCGINSPVAWSPSNKFGPFFEKEGTFLGMCLLS